MRAVGTSSAWATAGVMLMLLVVAIAGILLLDAETGGLLTLPVAVRAPPRCSNVAAAASAATGVTRVTSDEEEEEEEALRTASSATDRHRPTTS